MGNCPLSSQEGVMRVHCKSVKIISSEVTESTRTSYTMRTTYDMGSVRDHTFDLPVRGHWSHLYRVPLLMLFTLIVLGIVALVLGWALTFLATGREWMDAFLEWVKDHYPASYVAVAAALVLLALPISYALSCSHVRQTLTEQAVCRERQVDDTYGLKIVPEKKWPSFLKSLR
jgi:hypothetical protein